MKNKFMACVILSVFAVTLGFAGEKITDDSEFVLTSRAATYIDTLTGADTYDRIFTSDVNTSCNATSTFSGSGVGVPYISIPIHSTTGENIECSLNPGTTTVTDSVISLYCAPFDPLNADQNLVAYDDDGGSGLLSGFVVGDGAFMTANTTYYLVVSTFSPSNVGGGAFTVDFGGDIQVGEAVTIPTMSEWGLILMCTLLAVSAVIFMRKK